MCPIVPSQPSVSSSTSVLIRKLGHFYLLYLGLLPILATFALAAAYGTRFPMLVFLGGVGAVGVYLAATYSYTRLPERLLPLFLLLIDGPLFVFLALRDGFHPLAFAIEGYLVDGTAIWLSILILASLSPLPTPGQRVASIFFMLVALAVTTSMFWSYLQEHVWGDGLHLAWLLGGIAEASLASFFIVRKDNVLRQDDGSILYIAGLVLLWVLALFAGLAVNDSGVDIWGYIERG
jgi:hypothetical protein